MSEAQPSPDAAVSPPERNRSALATLVRRASAGAWDEWRAAGPGHSSNVPVAHWQRFVETLGPAGWADLAVRHHRVGQRVQEDGATYNVYADGDEVARPWPLALLPFIVGADDWAQIERGVVQRARLLEATMADLYGPQQLLRDALLPASLIYAHPQYLRPARGLQPAGDQWLHLVAFDLMRGPSGRFSLLAQRAQAPSGLGYLLENRLLIPPQFREQFAELNVQRVAASFRALLDGLLRASPAGARSRIVLLTPGPLNETYFEQAFLARYLGVTLVEGGDLTVRGQHLFLKTMHGLEPVHVVLRRVDDVFLDPLELRADSALGVPGLMQALRAGTVVLANAPGAGVLESPGLAAFWPGVAERLLDERLVLPAATSWWCGEGTVWAEQREHLADYVVAPTFPDSGFGPAVAGALTPEERARLAARIDANPAAYTLQARVRLSEAPVWAGGEIQPRAAVLRVFAVADGTGGWRVLSGGLTRVAGGAPAGGVAGGASDPWLSMQHGSASADTWVITRGAVDDSTLLPRPLSAADLQGWHRSVTSRAAENLFWLGRYTERAENTVRLARLVLEALPGASAPALRLLGDLAVWHGLVPPGVPSPQQSPRVFERALLAGLRGEAGAGGVGHNLRRLRHCALALRERLSPEHWRLIHEVDRHFDQHLGHALAGREGRALVPDVQGVLARAATHLSAITGAQTDRMTRDDGWRLLSVGRQIERLDMLAHALALGFELRVHEPDDGFALLLGLFDSLITYRAQFQARREVLPLLHLLVFDTDNPRSLAWVARTMRDRLRKLARGIDADWAFAVTADFPQPASWDLAACGEADADGGHAKLVAALRQCCSAARALSDEIGRHLFVHVASSPEHRVWQ
ncbi:circularly permuted type 2 ATP-grasp protein [Aquabacterium sp. OR-4]|uniref:circularly permuted type 2 ATP-grasp protein n=1 Tax=Aquabacterium sp. OR-4 TaxID=2978127 RepID=UPI0028C60581|nr:circularly permuted type 2 ATP-grasp protein [Aquabacterium sp. OR-4]MDT7835220.1 circularly permuted type 2 ATP-grasp protein [Aquabacterium sp. OR-4]